DNRLDVLDHGAGGTVRADPQTTADDVAAERGDVRDGARAGARQPDVGGVDPQAIHRLQDGDLGRDGRIDDAGALQPVAQRLVVEHDAERRFRRLVVQVPVVDQI